MVSLFLQSTRLSLVFISFFFVHAGAPFHLEKRGISNDLPGNWSYKGCYSDNVASRTLSGLNYATSTRMTEEACIAFCDINGYVYAGTEYSAECYCDNHLDMATKASDGEAGCNMACSGNKTQTCGGGSRLTLFWSGGKPPTTPTTNPGIGEWTSLGCYNDTAKARTLKYGGSVLGGSSNMSILNCVNACSNGSYAYAGVENGGECYCGNNLSNYGGPALEARPGCSKKCNGNSSEFCGGANRLNLYQFGVLDASNDTFTFRNTFTAYPTTTSITVKSSSTSTRNTKSSSRISSTSTSKFKLSTSPKVPTSKTSATSTSSKRSTSSPTSASVTVPASSSPLDQKSSASSITVFQSSASVNSHPSSMSSGLSRSSKNSITSSSKTSSSATSTAFAAVLAAPSPSAWNALGCYTDSVAARTLQFNVAVEGGPDAVSHETCTAACHSSNYQIAGMEYSGECWCDNAFNNGGTPAPDGEVGCNMACNGNTTEMCGGSNRLTVYSFGTLVSPSSSSSSSTGIVTGASSSLLAGASSSIVSSKNPTTTSSSSASAASATTINGWTVLGCYTDSTAGRALSVNVGVTGGPSEMSIEACINACKSSGYQYAGTEYAAECWCGNSVLNDNGPAPDGNAQCNMACNGDASEICGGPNRLSMFFNGVAPPPISSTTKSASSTTTAPPTATGLPKGWKYAGCYVDNLAGRIMTGQQPDNQDTTIEGCIATCIGLGFNVTGIEYGVQCFCDNALRNGAELATSDNQCGMVCPGNNAEKCGDGNRMSTYYTGNLTIYSVPVPKTTDLPGDWTYKGCLSDNGDDKTLPKFVQLGQSNSPENCLSQCSKYGYNAAGMEYGVECYCGDIGDVAKAGATLQPESECSFSCPADPEALCGAGNLLTYYTWTGTPITEFSFPSGLDAGAYEFLIGGVIIPLMTQPAINGKVVFLEKWGTGPANTTGTYELDLALLDDFSKAWRPLNVKTDIFCSAGLTLPDKVGRQINVGGWSGDSTYGIRIYWPDGSPGVWGVNDWQENFNEVKLQNGRWYPTAMIMANGSILVVGGENGSNGPPVPTLEILPQVGPVLYMDWLERTDPNNLYPFLAVLPSGGIFVAYWNEARILNEVDFSTTKTLPNMPGAVNDDAGGRTYPLEGSMVLLPQYAPYTAPLGVLICGGSMPYTGAGLAIDNCVSTTPESADPEWIIEKMPSERVLSCMTALPDGTYLILNGAHRGVAGFGLASDANHNAVLYDPTKPIGRRMSVMANTTVDRFYHSEAVLLQDGRVLVSGSDPETDGLLQEYRVEVFVPPYLLNGGARPAYSLANKDWAHGETVTLTITGGTAARVSLLGAESSTHGNSMGQRTFFPATTCGGGVCTVTAPPNSHVCPPGWFQVFVLSDEGVPSLGQWVRIGGDPGALGEWPGGLDDFNVPGL